MNKLVLPNTNLYGLAYVAHLKSLLYAIQDRFDATMCMSFLRSHAPTDWHRCVDYEINRLVFSKIPTVLGLRVQHYWIAEYDGMGHLHYHGGAIFPPQSALKRDPEHGDVLRESLAPIQKRIESVAKKYWSHKASFYIEPTYDYQKAIDYNLKELTPTTDVIFNYIDLREAQFLANNRWSFGHWFNDFKRTGKVTGAVPSLTPNDSLVVSDPFASLSEDSHAQAHL